MATNDGSKAHPYTGKDLTYEYDAAKVTKIEIKRTGKVYTASWTNMATYSSMKITFRLKKQFLSDVKRRIWETSWDNWRDYTTMPTGTSSWDFVTINYNNYNPNDEKFLKAIEVKILVDQATTVQNNVVKYSATNKKYYSHKVTTKYKSAAETKVYDIHDPKKPQITITDGASDTSFSIKVPESNTDGINVTTKIRWWDKAISDWGNKDPSGNTDWGSEHSATSSTGKFSSDTRTDTNAVGAADVTRGQSKTVLVQAQAQGPNGNSDYAYAKLVYSYPYAAKDLKASTPTTRSTGWDVNVSWTRAQNGKFPANQYKLWYYIGKPSASNGLYPPSGASWTAVTTDFIDYGASKASIYVPSRLTADSEQCLWYKVTQRNVQSLTTDSAACRIYAYSKIKNPVINSVSYDASSHNISISVNNTSTFTDSKVTAYWGSVKIGEVTGNSSQTITGNVNLGESPATISVVTNYGDVKSDTISTTYDPLASATTPTGFVPTILSAEPVANQGGKITVKWNHKIKNATGSIVTYATSEDAWTQPTSYTSVTITGGSTTQATIDNLTLNNAYYFRVQSVRGNDTTGFSNMASTELNASNAPVPTNSTIAEDGNNHDIIITINWNDWPQAKQIHISHSTDETDTEANTVVVSKNVISGTQIHRIKASELERGYTNYVWLRFAIDDIVGNASPKKLDMLLSLNAPTNITLVRTARDSDAEGETSATLSWNNNGSTDVVSTLLTWSEDLSDWSSSEGAHGSYGFDGAATSMVLTKLALGQPHYYAKVRLIYNDTFYKESTLTTPLDLRTTPSTPVVHLSKTVVSQYSSIDVSWTYSNEDLSDQSGAVVYIYNASDVLTAKIAVDSSEKSVSIAQLNTYGIVGDQQYHAIVYTTSANGISSEASEAAYFDVVTVPIVSITTTSLVDEVYQEGTENEGTVKELQSMPLTLTVSSTPSNCKKLVYIERTVTTQIARPDESMAYGYAGELVAVVEQDSGSFSITQGMLQTNFTDDGQYRIYAYAINEIGIKSEPATIDFTVKWSYQAQPPTAGYVIDENNLIAKITPHAPTGAAQTDTFDIYRLSADKPELIISDGTWEETYVDPYMAFGDKAGHRIVTKTATGDYTTADGSIAWLDCYPPASSQVIVDTDNMIIDFGGDSVDLYYNYDITHSWVKDFTQTTYLGGSVQGDWNPAVTRKASAGGTMIKLIEADKIYKMRRLATYPAICHVRTPDGSSFAADIQVTEAWSSDKHLGFAEYTLDITRVDGEDLDGMTLDAWEAVHGLG